MWSSKDDLFEAIGSLGGFILAFALLPQIYAVHKTRSTKDISYTWQAVYATGLMTVMVYYAYFNLWAVFIPISIELWCILYLTVLKIYFEQMAPKRPDSSLAVTENMPLSYQKDISKSTGTAKSARML